MIKKLKKIYFLLIFPVIVLFAVYGVLKEIRPSFVTLSLPPELQFLFFVISTLTAVAGPVFIRTYYASKVKDLSHVEEESFYGFQRNLIISSMVTPYIALFSMVFSFSDFYSAFIAMFSLYAVYYFYPSEKRISFDRRIFRVK